MARISTHVLDMVLGHPAAGMRIELFSCVAERHELIRTALTNSDGRTDEPLMSTAMVLLGTYELVFHAGAYFRDTVANATPRIFDVITIRFEVGDPGGNYHIPLLLAPNGYTTYRGS